MDIIFLSGKNRHFVKVVRSVFIFWLLILLCGCDVNAGKRPSNYPGTVWTCKDPQMQLIVPMEGDMQFLIQEESNYPEDTVVAFDYGSRIMFHSNQLAKSIFVGTCSFHVDRLIVSVTKDELFDGRYLNKQIVFYRDNVSFAEYLSEYWFMGVLLLHALAGIMFLFIMMRRKRRQAINQSANRPPDNQGTVQNH